MITLDFWYRNKLKDVASIDCFFSDLDCVYRGNMYDKNRKMIGDYETADSLKIEETFNIKFN